MTIEESIKKENEFMTGVLMESAKRTARWIVFGIIGFSIFGVCLGILGVLSIIKVLFF